LSVFGVVAASHLALWLACQWGKRPNLGRDDTSNLLTAHDFTEVPSVRGPNIHELDEAQWDVSLSAGLGDWNDLVFVHAFSHNGVDLDFQSGFESCVNPSKDVIRLECISVCHGLEGCLIQCVQTYGDPVEPRLHQGWSLLFEENSVGCHRQVHLWSKGSEHADEFDKVSSQQGFSASEPYFLKSSWKKGSNNGADFFVGQQFTSLKKSMFGAEVFPWHAVRTTEIAAIGD
jgi:hypothetical protein